jgi:4-hydroxybenzoate polyprenyltransferase
MILNDVYDYEQDMRQRPQRPLPSGRIGRQTATIAGYVLLALGVSLATVAGVTYGAELDWRPGGIAAALATCVVLYDCWLKTTPVGPITMGGCRTLNILLAMSCAWLSLGGAGQGGFAERGLDAAQLTVAAAFGIYIAGVTWFARHEAGTNQRGLMIGGLLVIITGLSLLAMFPQSGDFTRGRSLTLRPDWMWPLLVLLSGIAIVRRCLVAIATLEPARIQAAVKHCILSLIVLDAAVCLAVRSPVWWAVGIVSLLLPAFVLGRYFYST